MTPEQHSLLAQLAQLGLQKLTEDASAALQSCAPEVPETTPSVEEITPPEPGSVPKEKIK